MRLNLRRNAVQWARSGLTVILAGMALLALIQIGLFVRVLTQSMAG
ncbi:hypothetical protein M9M90_16205 [Phenylobacterium sp. LH3H17]|nr:hypothetical protein [Phenylobacterium sp. LH3H17]UTP38754.1 hypothetical protein M9M90_16205 [Phenylobacterium sp. LH3H17]